MDEIDPAATQRKIDGITEDGIRALERSVEASSEIDQAAAAEQAKLDQEIKDLREASDRKEAAREEELAKQEAPPAPWANRPSRPTVLSFGGEELDDPAPPPPPAPQPLPAVAYAPPPPPVEPVAAPPPQRYLSFGMEEDEAEAAPPPVRAPRQAPRRPVAEPDDDDFSGHSWVR